MKPFNLMGMKFNMYSMYVSDGEDRVLEFGECRVPLHYHYSQVHSKMW